MRRMVLSWDVPDIDAEEEWSVIRKYREFDLYTAKSWWVSSNIWSRWDRTEGVY